MAARIEGGWERAGVLVLGLAGLSWLLPAAVVRANERVVPETRIESPRSVALGTGMRSASASTQAQADNPANLPVGHLYHIESFFAYEPQLKRMSWGAAAVDSMTSQLAAGLSVRGLFGDNDAGEHSGWEGRLALALPVGDAFSLGLAGRYVRLRVSDPFAVPEPQPEPEQEQDPEAEPPPPDQSFRLRGFTLDAAATLRLEGLALSALAYNLIDLDSPLAPVMVGGAASYTAEQGLSIGGDVLVDLNRHDAFSGTKLLMGGGLEYFAGGVAPVRLGYRYDQGRQQHAITAGLGYVEPRFGVQLAVRHQLGEVRETALMSGVQYFMR